jgi:D-alanyl-D-alanine carboxypeptidase (penicillin-binding protein 5/6)
MMNRRNCLPGNALGLLAAVVAVLIAAFASGPVSAQRAASAQSDLTTKARQAILMDAETGAILFQHNSDQPMAPASMSKLMTLAVVFKAIKAGQIKLDDQITMSVNAWRKGGGPSGTSAMLVPVNTKETLESLLQGVIVQSGNDAAIALAEGISGSEEAFAQVMNEEGLRIGLKRSTFRNATGLHDPEHLMTARDLAVLARHLIKDYPEHYQRFAQREFNYRKHKFINRNPLLGAQIGVDGLKTGYIKEAGYGIVASAVQNERRLILVVNGLDKPDERRSEAIRLLEWGFKAFTEFRLFDDGEVVGKARVWGGDRMWVPLVGKGSLSVVLPRLPTNQRLRAEIIYKGPLKSPIRKGDQIATLRVTSSTRAVNELPLYAGETVERAGLARRGLDSLLHLALRWAL